MLNFIRNTWQNIHNITILHQNQLSNDNNTQTKLYFTNKKCTQHLEKNIHDLMVYLITIIYFPKPAMHPKE